LIHPDVLVYNVPEARAVSESDSGGIPRQRVTAWMPSGDADVSGLMYDPDDLSHSRPHREKEYQDYHFHDDDEIDPSDDAEPRKVRPPAPRKPNRRVPPSRHYDQD
jgi:hypothetical protein